MERKYSVELLNKIKEKQYFTTINGINVLMKPIPDCDEEGMMDPRLYNDNKKMAMMMRFLPKNLFKMDASPKSIERLRKMFNAVKSVDIASDKIEVMQKTIKGLDGNDIPLLVYLPIIKKEKAPVLYYIHGGGFFGGHSGVVDQLVKLVVEKFNIVAVSIDYRLAPENPYPKGHEDCFEGLKWVYANCASFGGNPNAMFVAGDSAGGNLTQYCTTRDLETKGKMVKGQILLYPTVNMACIEDEYTHWSLKKYTINPKHAKVLKPTIGMMGGSVTLLGDLLQVDTTMNPYLTPYMMDCHGLPPTLISVGEFDYLKIETLAFARKLVEAGVDTHCIVYKGLGHAYGDNVGVYPQSEDCAEEIGNFIMQYKGEDE